MRLIAASRYERWVLKSINLFSISEASSCSPEERATSSARRPVCLATIRSGPLDAGIGKHFAFTSGLRYLDTGLDIQGGQSVAVKPVVGRLGVAVRF